MAQTKINKENLGPLSINDDDIGPDGLSLDSINQSGAATNQVAQWDGEKWTPVSLAAGSIYVDNETPDGVVNGINKTFTLEYQPSPLSSVQIFRGGILLRQGEENDYSVVNQTITFAVAPEVNDVLVAFYRR